jgi:hypothetical protein
MILGVSALLFAQVVVSLIGIGKRQARSALQLPNWDSITANCLPKPVLTTRAHNIRGLQFAAQV